MPAFGKNFESPKINRQTAQTLPLSVTMNPIDLIIIYFSCGAPFAVYFFLQNRNGEKTGLFWLRNLFVFLFWIPFAASLLMKKRNLFDLTFLNTIFSKDLGEEKVSTLQKQIENLLIKNELNISVFDFRETVERYAGLTLASKIETANNSEQEIFRAAKNENIELGTICLHRRNRNKLIRHQTEARRDFLRIVEQLFEVISDTKLLQYPALEMVKILGDEAAQKSLEKMFAENMQTEKLLSVEYSEKDLWKPQERKPLTETISTQL